jgi:hypothetical protein
MDVTVQVLEAQLRLMASVESSQLTWKSGLGAS